MSSYKFTDESRTRNTGDDSSSVSSMSSFSRRYMCHFCKEPEVLHVKPLIRCDTCKRSWHLGCHMPRLDGSRKGAFHCSKCVQKMNTTTANSPLSTPSRGHMRVGSSVSESTSLPDRLAAQNKCRMQGCTAPVYQSRSNSNTLCKHHEVEERHRNATAQKQVVGVRVPPIPKPFQKKKLYPVKPDEDMKTLKRKRPSYGQSSGYYSELSTIDVPSSMPHFQSPHGGGSRSPLASVGDQPPQTYSQIQTPQSLSNNVSTRERVSIRWPPPPTVEDEDMVEPPIEMSSLSNLTVRPVNEAKDFTKSQTMENDGRDNVGSPRSANENGANVPEPPLVRLPDDVRMTGRTLVVEPISRQLRQEKSAPRVGSLHEEVDVVPSLDDVEMQDCPALPSMQSPIRGNVLETVEDQQCQTEESTYLATDTTPILRSPALALVSRSTMPGDDAIWENSNSEDAVSLPYSLEAQRQQRAETFDPSSLDSWLKKQSLADRDTQPTAQELIQTQMWGHIDPQVVWPKERSAEWLSEKRKEIEARGGRKANFGKVLTAQVIKERRERGWGIHQNKDVVDDEKSEIAAKALEELFGVKDIDDLEPGVRGGQLVMVEKDVDGEGKKRSKPAVYVVG